MRKQPISNKNFERNLKRFHKLTDNYYNVNSVNSIIVFTLSMKLFLNYKTNPFKKNSSLIERSDVGDLIRVSYTNTPKSSTSETPKTAILCLK